MSEQLVPNPQASPIGKTARLHYVDWLRVIAIMVVFLFHAVHPFGGTDWHIKNLEESEVLTILLYFLAIWGMPFFFLIAGSASWFALRRRSASQYVSERFKRLVIPFIVGFILFIPITMFLEWKLDTIRGCNRIPT